MVIGADTGFFIEYANGNPTAKEIWDKVSNGEEGLIVSVKLVLVTAKIAEEQNLLKVKLI